MKRHNVGRCFLDIKLFQNGESACCRIEIGGFLWRLEWSPCSHVAMSMKEIEYTCILVASFLDARAYVLK